MGGWVTAETLAHDASLLGGVVISAGDFGAIGLQANEGREAVIAMMNDNRESLAGVTGESMADEVKEHGEAWSFKTLAPELVHRKLLVLYSNDFVSGFIGARQGLQGRRWHEHCREVRRDRSQLVRSPNRVRVAGD
jgi:hypothetical protein